MQTKPTDSHSLCCPGAGFGSLEQGRDVLRLSRQKVTTVCWIARFLQKSLKTTLILKYRIWLRDNWDMLIENSRWPMTAFHKASHTHPDTYLRRPLGNRCCTRGKAPVQREKSSITHSCPKTLCWPLPPKISATFHTNMRVKKARKRNYRKHNFSNKEFYSFETGELRCPASMDSCP